MSGISLDHTAALEALARLVADGQEQHRRHTASAPDLPASAAGRDFADRGAAIAGMLQRVHARGGERIDAVRVTAQAAVEQVDAFRDVDADFADALRGRS